MVLPMQRLNHRDSGKPTASGDPAAEPEQLEQVVAGADEQTIIAALERDTGLTIWQAWTPTGATQGRFSRLAGVGGHPNPENNASGGS